MVKRQVVLVGFNESMWQTEHSELILDFIRDEREDSQLLLFYINSNNNFVVSHKVPTSQVDQLLVMTRVHDVKITPQNFMDTVHFELIKSSYLESILLKMSCVYGPMFFNNVSWPDSIFSNTW